MTDVEESSSIIVFESLYQGAIFACKCRDHDNKPIRSSIGHTSILTGVHDMVVGPTVFYLKTIGCGMSRIRSVLLL